VISSGLFVGFDGQDDKEGELSTASKFNRITLRKLQKALDKNPEVDLTSIFHRNTQLD